MEDVLEVISARGLEVTDAQLQVITGCKDEDQLRRWHRRAVTLSSVEEILASS
jgi:hypothetical protein